MLPASLKLASWMRRRASGSDGNKKNFNVTRMSLNNKIDGGNPSAVNKNPKVIKAAQKEIGKIDVLVCGSCFNVFHFIEEFQLHKLQEECINNPEFKQPSQSETKPQVWAFLLWKSSILNENKRFGDNRQGDELGSWHLYQSWCKLEEKVRDSWIAAGRAIQGFASIANAKIQEVRSIPDKGRVIVTKPASQDGQESPRSQPPDKTASQSKAGGKKIPTWSDSFDADNTSKDSAGKNETTFDTKDKDGALRGRLRGPEPLNVKATRSKLSSAASIEDNYDSNHESSPGSSSSHSDSLFNSGPEAFVPDIEIKEEQVTEDEAESLRESIDGVRTRSRELGVRSMHMNSNKVVRKSIKDSKMGGGNMATGEEEYVVEKILAKRYNPKKKCFEYLLKWEGYPHEQNTWEPVENMQTCENLVETFERNLAKQKMMQQQHRPPVPSPIQPPQRPAPAAQRPAQQQPQQQQTTTTRTTTPPPQRPARPPTPRLMGMTSTPRPLQPQPQPQPQLQPQPEAQPEPQPKVVQQQAVRLWLEPPPLTPIVQKKLGRTAGPRLLNSDLDMDHLEAGPSDMGSDSRPVRSSKKKALEQVKSWCGTMAKTMDFDGKRKHGEDSESDIDDPPEKRVKSEPDYDREWSGGEMDDVNDSNASEEDMPKKLLQRYNDTPHPKLISVNHSPIVAPVEENKVVVKRRPGRPRKEYSIPIPNGMALTPSGTTPLKKPVENKLSVELGLESDSSPERKKVFSKLGGAPNSQTPVLVANSKGIITVDPRHVPNLTSGVFIVSKKPSSIVCESQNADKTSLGDAKSSVAISKSPSSSGNIIVDIKSTLPQSGIIRKNAVTSRNTLNPVKIMPKPGEQVNNKTSTGQSDATEASQPKPGQSKVTNPTASQVRPISSGLVRLPAPVRSPVITPRTPATVRPLVAGQRALGPHSVAMMSARPGMGLGSRPPPLAYRTGIRRSPMLGNRPRMPSNVTSLSPGTQVKSGIKPIHAMLGKTVQNYGKLSPLAQQKMAQKPPTEGGTEVRTGDKITIVPNSAKDIINVVDVKTSTKGRPPKVEDSGLSVNKVRDSKLVDSDSLHMEFQEVHTSSDSDDSSEGGLPELPMGDLPPLEPESPPRPFSLCPETGKILMRAEGEATPPPSPEPVLDPPKIEPDDSKSGIELTGESLAVNSLPILDAEKIEPGTIVHEGTPEEILPDRRDDDDDDDMMPGLGQQTLLKVEMSPGGTTGTLVRRDSATAYMDTVRTEQGVTVTKISSSDTRSSQEVVVTSTTSPAKLGGISVPARKLFEPDDAVVAAGNGGVGTELVTITGEDGVVYQIATDASGEGGGQDGACVYVTADQDGEGTVLTLDTAVAEAVAQLLPDQVVAGGGAGGPQFFMKGADGEGGQVMITSGLEQGGEETLQAQVVAQVVQEGESASGSGGTRRVVLMLPDGNLMMTEVDEEQFAALDLDK